MFLEIERAERHNVALLNNVWAFGVVEVHATAAITPAR
jgi:hypothetical protein